LVVVGEHASRRRRGAAQVTYRGYHAFWRLYGIGLPDEVLKKAHYKNALTITPRLPQTGWPR
jgi:hypothetical protein